MSILQVANVHLNSAGSSRIETIDSGANVRIVIESANVMYSNPVRTVFPTGTVNVSNDMTVAGALRGSGVANIAGDMTVAGNIYAAGGASPLGAPSIVVTAGGTTITDIPSGKYFKITCWASLPGNSGSGQPRIYLSSDNGISYSVAKFVCPPAGANNIVDFIVMIANTAVNGASKTITSMGRLFRVSSSGALSLPSPTYTMVNTYTESSVTGIINAIKANCDSGVTLAQAQMMIESIN